MAHAALNSLLQTLKQIRQPQQRIASLQDKVIRLRVMLEDCSRNPSLRIDHLEAQIRDASYDVEYIIESYVSRQAFSKPIGWRVSTCFREIISALRLCERSVEYADQNMDMDSQGLQKRIDEFDSVLETLYKMYSSALADSSRFFAGRESTMVGRDEDMMYIREGLAGPSAKLDVISVVGMGGVGKTTLVRNICNDPFIEHHFDILAWTVVSQEYNVRKLFLDLLHSTTHAHDGRQLHQMDIEDLAEHLYRRLKYRRYLIVMDDVWDIKAWDKVRKFFPDDHNGSRVILTTRLSEVAIYANSYGHIHHMRPLSPEASWSLLLRHVLGKEHCPPSLEEIGSKIVRDCHGLPLAILVIGGILSKGIWTRDYWEFIEENVKSAETGNDDVLMDILSLICNSLPPHLKPCFLYMGVFPEDHEIFVSQLTKMWIAEGFIKPVAPKSLEELAEDYLKDLIERNLIMVREISSNGRIKTCTIHDLLRDLCLKIAYDEKFLQIINSNIQVFPEGKTNQLRVSIHSDTSVHLTNIHDSSVRSLLYFYRRFSNSELLSIIMSCRLLRVLDALTIRFYKFPIEIVELVHLRYLAFTYEGMKDFPASISKLRDLQTLIVYRGDTFTLVGKLTTLYLPSTIWEMPQLRHLLFEKILLPATVIAKDSVALENLQTLSGITNFKCSREVMEMIPNLKKLGISYFYGADTEWSSYEFNNFVYLRKLETLKFNFIAESDEALQVNLTFPPNLRKLTLSGCRISWEKMTIVGSLANLEVLKLKDHAFEGPIWEPNEGEFSKLKYLLIEDSNLEQWRANETHFPKLQHLRLSYCPKLVDIPIGFSDIPMLRMLELWQCSDSAMYSARQIQIEQEEMGNPRLSVEVKSSRGY